MLKCPGDKGDPNRAAQIPIQTRILAAPLLGIIKSQCFSLMHWDSGKNLFSRESDLSYNETQGQLTQSSTNTITSPNYTSTGNVSLSEAPAERCLLRACERECLFLCFTPLNVFISTDNTILLPNFSLPLRQICISTRILLMMVDCLQLDFSPKHFRVKDIERLTSKYFSQGFKFVNLHPMFWFQKKGITIFWMTKILILRQKQRSNAYLDKLERFPTVNIWINFIPISWAKTRSLNCGKSPKAVFDHKKIHCAIAFK